MLTPLTDKSVAYCQALGAATAIRALADRGRLATITTDPPRQERGLTVANTYVRSDGSLLRRPATHFAAGQLHIPVIACYSLTDAAQVLVQATGSHTPGAITVTLRP